MILSKKIIIVSFIIAVSGFIHAALSNDRTLGIAIFLTGFFLACGTAVITVLATSSHTFGGKMGVGVKIMVAGFGL
ncbi:MAG: hypothetical protein KZQ67_13320, partial [gamma proteobacterium symbiont of Bathyaustriella thionipta]|nr:hypothetical protein [gamma proteobacterium symbiont of Bathyaustriella thionipta]